MYKEQVLQYIKDYIAEHSYAPSYREIADHCDISISTVCKALTDLEKERKILIDRGKARSITVH